MTSSNVDTVHRIYDAFANRDLAAILALMDPDVILRQDAPLPWGGTYTGPAGVQAFLGTLLSHIDPRLEIGEIIDAGGDIVQIGRTRGKALSTGKKFDAREIHLWRFNDGLVSGYTVYVDVPEMLGALS
jgi:uncharacterized protein